MRVLHICMINKQQLEFRNECVLRIVWFGGREKLTRLKIRGESVRFKDVFRFENVGNQTITQNS